MGRISCSEFANQIEAWLGGVKTADARAHANQCAACRGLAEDFGAIRATASSWGAEEVQPPERVWTALRAQLETEGLIQTRAYNPVGRSLEHRPEGLYRWFDGMLSAVPRPAMAAIYLAALLAISTTMVGPTSRQLNDSRWMERTQNSTRVLSAELNSDEEAAVSLVANSHLSVGASLNNGLAIVDNYIALCEKSVREEPENEVARDYLYTAYQQKADLLAQMDELGASGQ